MHNDIRYGSPTISMIIIKIMSLFYSYYHYYIYPIGVSVDFDRDYL